MREYSEREEIWLKRCLKDRAVKEVGQRAGLCLGSHPRFPFCEFGNISSDQPCWRLLEKEIIAVL